ncbi:hypothetical protein E1B28_000241 [Marasmius oreades]|uniref:CoA-binding domain-containing protein n=1 Tax=Marasmius oreades TaxID=181124 RepID=A0A9P8AE94_9AGAR|nr:uncharacterized protein E1B28_000241 [Marasmius oreades]KAG7098278.1 hypothetical protein E1B28_000241 [Marasmius oreades]
MVVKSQLQKRFLSNPLFAVVGASKIESKSGTKVLRWYKNRVFKVQPIHPREVELEGIRTIKSLEGLPLPSSTSVSIITPPPVTLNILKQAKALGVPYLWLQPGAEDASVINFIEENALNVIYGGPCILRDGDEIRHELRNI